MAITAGDQINRALRLLGVLAEGEIPSASESADSLMALNQMIDSWNTESLSIFTTLDQSFTWPSGQASQTLGPAGQLVGPRPVDLYEAYYIVNNITYAVTLINQSQYDSIPYKTLSTPYPSSLFINNDYPAATITLYPVPSQALTFHFISATELVQPALLSTPLSFPPGYLRAFAYNLALEISPEFGIEPSKDVRRIAMVSKRNLKRINGNDDVMSFPGPLLSGGSGFNIYSGS